MDHHALLKAWEVFYLIVGTSAGALTGLQFVVMALAADVPDIGTSDAVDAFGTPTVVHFCVSLFIAVVVSAPWPSELPVLWLLLGAGLVGALYTFIVIQRARRQTGYEPVMEDWLWHAIFPMTAYVILIAAAAMMHLHTEVALFLVGAVSLVLVYIGIHNAWDAVAYIAVQKRTRGP